MVCQRTLPPACGGRQWARWCARPGLTRAYPRAVSRPGDHSYGKRGRFRQGWRSHRAERGLPLMGSAARPPLPSPGRETCLAAGAAGGVSRRAGRPKGAAARRGAACAARRRPAATLPLQGAGPQGRLVAPKGPLEGAHGGARKQRRAQAGEARRAGPRARRPTPHAQRGSVATWQAFEGA
jgi:hypothetical protein